MTIRRAYVDGYIGESGERMTLPLATYLEQKLTEYIANTPDMSLEDARKLGVRDAQEDKARGAGPAQWME
jgi:hypothetical protein